MEAINWAGIAVAVIGIVTAWLSGRAARLAAKHSADASVSNARTLAETEAYSRARKMDTETIEHQEEEIKELRAENRELWARVRDLEKDNRDLHTSQNNVRYENHLQALEIEKLRTKVAQLEAKETHHE